MYLTDLRVALFLVVLFAGFVAVDLLLRARQTRAWKRVKALVVERVHDSMEGYSFDLRVEYQYEGSKYTSLAENWFYASRKRRVGDVVTVLVDPDNPGMCVLYY